MRSVALGALLCVLVFAGSVAAQEQRASMEGTVRDAQGAVLPGASVEARSTIGAVVSTVTDSAGVFRFPSLQPGLYEVTARMVGFNTGKFTEVELLLGQIKRLAFTLEVSGITEQVQVTGESPMVDVRQSARAVSIRAQQVDLLPKGRDFTSLVGYAPGANQETKLGGISIDGASAGENRFIVDGIETTNMNNGLSGKTVVADFIEEVQVKSSGYAAEYGGATGGVVSAVTKSGTNDLRGYGLLYFAGDALDSSYRPTLRRDPVDASKSQYWTFPEDDYTRYEPGIALGGPIARDRMWFFAAYQPSVTSTTRTVNKETSGNPGSTTWEEVRQKNNVHYFTANSIAQFGDRVRTRIAYNNSWTRRTGLLPNQDGTTAQTALLSVDRTWPNWSVSGTLDWVAASSVYFGCRAGYYLANFYDEGVPEETRYLYSIGNVGQAGVPVAFQKATGFTNIPTNARTVRDRQTRLFVQADGTWYASFGGQHSMKGGVQIDDLTDDPLSGEQANLVRLQWNRNLSGQRGTYGYYQIRSNGVDPRKGFITEGLASTTNIGLFFQDAWTIGNALTINAGVRTERERVPTYSTAPGVPKYGVKWGFGDKLAPRVGFAYDVKGDARWKAYGSWGIFYDIFKLMLPRGSWGGEKWLEYYFTLDTYDYTTLIANTACPATTSACLGTLIRGPVDFRHPSFGRDAIDPDLEPMRTQEMAFGLEHQLSGTMVVGARYVRKWLDRAVEDVGQLDENHNEIYLIANPGYGIAKTVYDIDGNIYDIPYPKAKRQYDSLELFFGKRFASNWAFWASYMGSRLWGNYSGLSQSDENGRTSPNVGRVFDYPIMMFTENGEASYGVLATDRPHQLKVSGIYSFAFGTTVGAGFYAASGLPVTRDLGVIPPNNFPVQYLGRKSDGRLPAFTQTDVFVQHEFRLGGRARLQVNLNVTNLFNQKTATNRFMTYQDVNGIAFNEADFYAGKVDFDDEFARQGLVQNPLFLKDSAYQGQLVARIGAKILF